MMISLIQAGSPLGVVAGYMLTFLVKKNNQVYIKIKEIF
jgi:hypothetical protein